MGSSDATFVEASCGDNGRARLPREQYLWLSSHLSQERLRLGVRFIVMPWSGWASWCVGFPQCCVVMRHRPMANLKYTLCFAKDVV